MQPQNTAVDNILNLIGNTPVIKLHNLIEEDMADIWAKLEFLNPAGSLKERIALRMIESAEEKGLISPGKSVIVEATSGNTGIGLALVSALKGYELVLTMPAGKSFERRQLLSAYGAEVILTPAEEQMEGAVKKAKEITSERENAVMLGQYNNLENPEAHKLGTGKEILEQVPPPIDAFVTTVGTGGTLLGVGEALREKYPHIKLIAVEPDESAVLSGDEPNVHDIQGVGPGFVPPLLKPEMYDKIERVSADEAAEFARKIALKEGLLVGISSGAAGLSAYRTAKSLGPGKQVVTIFCDTGERYLSTGLFGNG